MDNEARQEELNRLYTLYQKKDREFENAKLKRSIITIIGYAVAIFAILNYSAPLGWGLIGEFFAALFLSGILFLINSLVFSYLVRKGNEEKENLCSIQHEIDALNK